MPSYNYKLYYFNIKGRGEIARLMFAYADVEYDDARIKLKDWPALKDDMPYKQLPVLEVDGKRISQSHAIERYLAREFGLTGKTSFQNAKSDEFAEVLIDAMEKIPWYEKDEEKKKMLMEKIFNEDLPSLLSVLESKIEDEYTTGSEVVLSDIVWAAYADLLLALNPDILKATPKLLSIYEKIFAHPRIAKYVAARPTTSM